MIYKVCLTAKANKVYSEADSVLRKKIAKCLRSIASESETIGLFISLMIVNLKLLPYSLNIAVKLTANKTR